MSVSDAYARAYCDKCDYSEEVDLTALARRNEYDMRNVAGDLRQNGWTVSDDFTVTICDSCTEEATEGTSND
jgi:hypothetical protein